MPLTLNLLPQTELRLLELATQSGQELADYTATVLQSHVEAQHEGGGLLQDAVRRMMRRTPAEVAKTRSDAAQFIRPGKPLPEGLTILEAVAGQWPGDESDQEVADSLRKLS